MATRSSGARWIEAFGKETLPSRQIFAYWVNKYPAEVFQGAFKATIKRNLKPGSPFTVEHRAKFFSSVATRLAELGTRVGTAFELTCKNYAASKRTDADAKVALDLLEVLVEKGPDGFYDVYFGNSTSPYREQAEQLLKRLGPDITWGQMRAAAVPVVNQ